MNHQSDTVLNRFFDPFIGFYALTFGLVTSLQEQVEYILRVASLLIGIIIGLVTLYRTLKRK
jgi:hypothetical protein